jgi:hypothetical protein
MEINGQITVDEISKSVKDLKIEKTCYDDNIINEYIKSWEHFLIPIYFISFNCILVRVHGYREILYPYSKQGKI